MSLLIKRIGLSALLFCVGAIIGPLLLAATAAIISANQNKVHLYDSSEAQKFMEIYRHDLTPGRLLLTVALPPDGEECGYESQNLFPDSQEQLSFSVETRSFSYYAGYWALDQWRNDTRDEAYVSAVTWALEKEVGAFELGFLRRCISSTAFKDLCHGHAEKLVQDISSRVPRYDHGRDPTPMLGYGVENEIVCTYADGVAARAGIPLEEQEQD